MWKDLLADLSLQFVLTGVGSSHWLCLCLSVVVRLASLIFSDLSVVHLSSLFFSLGHFLCFTLSYAEILPWETCLLIFLFLLNVRSRWTESFVDRPSTRFLFVNVAFFVYALHLCLTTICTPSMYFNWFLIIHNCRYTYSNRL